MRLDGCPGTYIESVNNGPVDERAAYNQLNGLLGKDDTRTLGDLTIQKNSGIFSDEIVVILAHDIGTNPILRFTHKTPWFGQDSYLFEASTADGWYETSIQPTLASTPLGSGAAFDIGDFRAYARLFNLPIDNDCLPPYN